MAAVLAILALLSSACVCSLASCSPPADGPVDSSPTAVRRNLPYPRPLQPRAMVVQRLPLRPLPPRPYPLRPGTRIPYLPFFRVMPAPPLPPPAPAPLATSPPPAPASSSKDSKVKVHSGLENSSEAQVEVLPVNLVVDVDVLATGILDLLNTLDETGLLPADEATKQFKSSLESAKEGEHRVFQVDPKSVNVILNELIKSQM